MVTFILAATCIVLGFIIAIQGNHLKGEITELKLQLDLKDASHIVEKAKVKKESTL